jgi:hypothetical protein
MIKNARLDEVGAYSFTRDPFCHLDGERSMTTSTWQVRRRAFNTWLWRGAISLALLA